MIFSDVHVHTSFCDGENKPEEMVKTAIDIGLKTIGLVAHSFVFFDKEGSLKPEQLEEFQAEVNRLKVKYHDQIQVLCGIERDTVSDDVTGFDYVIGDVHYFKKEQTCIALDNGEERFVSAVNQLFDGDYLSAVENYYERMSKVVEITHADYIGHFDLVQKYNENDKYFDSNSARYISAYQKAVDELIKFGVPFEINIGAMIKGKAEPYPSRRIIEYIKSKGGKFIINSDSHSAQALVRSMQFKKENANFYEILQLIKN